MKNLAAFTKPEATYPAFVSINESESGMVSITVRSEKTWNEKLGYDVEGGKSYIELTPDEWKQFLASLHP